MADKETLKDAQEKLTHRLGLNREERDDLDKNGVKKEGKKSDK